MLYKISSAFLDNLLLPRSSFSLLTLSVPEIRGAVLLLHNGLGLTCLPTQVWHYCAVFADRLENFYCSYNKLNILSLHKCLHGKIFMNNFPPAFITHLCRKALYVYWPSDAMRALKPLTLQTVSLKLNYLFLFLCHWLSWAALWVVCVSLLIVEIEGQSEASLPVVSVCSLFVWSARYIVLLCVCVCVCARGRDRKSSSPTQGERDGGSKLMFTVLSQWMRAPCGSSQLWAEKLKQPKTYAHPGSGEEENHRAGEVEEEGKKCRPQDPVGSHLNHLENTLINKLLHTSQCETLSHFSVHDLIQIIPFSLVSL